MVKVIDLTGDKAIEVEVDQVIMNRFNSPDKRRKAQQELVVLDYSENEKTKKLKVVEEEIEAKKVCSVSDFKGW